MASPVDCGGVVSSVWEFLPTAGVMMGSVFFLFHLFTKWILAAISRSD